MIIVIVNLRTRFVMPVLYKQIYGLDYVIITFYCNIFIILILLD